MDPITIALQAIQFSYSILEKYVFGPKRKADDSKSMFNLTDFKRNVDKYHRAPQSIFSPFRGFLPDGSEWFDKVMYFAGFEGNEDDWDWAYLGLAGYIAHAMSNSNRTKQMLYGYIDKRTKFNADSLFELYAYFCYQHGGEKATEYVFHKIINPMFNMGLNTVDNANTNNLFTAPDRRFFWLYDDYLLLKKYASSEGQDTFTVYTQNRENAISLSYKPYAIALLNLLSQYPFQCGYFVDGLSDPLQIMAREYKLLPDMQITPATPPPTTPPPTTPPPTTPPADIKKETSTVNTIIEKVGLALIAAAILYLIIEIFKKIKKHV